MRLPEEETFVVLQHMMERYRLRGMFRPGMRDVLVRLGQLDALVSSLLPALADHFAEVGVLANMYATQWCMTLFAATFHPALASRIIDLFLVDGFIVVFQVQLIVLTLMSSVFILSPCRLPLRSCS